jgi:effector-binding domain-containing protein
VFAAVGDWCDTESPRLNRGRCLVENIMALTQVQVTHVTSIPLAVVRRQARASELAVAVPAGCGVVWSFVRAHQLQAGRHVAVYWDGTIRLEVGVELNGHFPDGGDIVRSATPAGRAASVVHLGPYDQLGMAHQAIRDWCSAHRHELAGPNWEIYGHWQNAWNADPSQIRTDVFYQLAPGGSSAA